MDEYNVFLSKAMAGGERQPPPSKKLHLILLISTVVLILPAFGATEDDSPHFQDDDYDLTTAKTSEVDPDGEVEIEDVPIGEDENDRVFHHLTSAQSSSDDNNSGEDNKGKGSSDLATAVAKVYEDPVHNYIHGEEKDTTKPSGKPPRIKVACLLPVQSLNSSGEGEDEQVKEPPRAELGVVEIVNTTTLLQDILFINPSIKTRATPSNCSIVLFFARWCPFSAKAAPNFNALPRAFPNLKMAAIDSTVHPTVNTYFGILSVPTVILFHNGKIIAKFNDTSFTLNKFADFVHAFTDLKSVDKINVTSQDFHGPLPSVPQKERDFYLYLAWVFIVICFLHYLSKSVIWRKVIDLVRTTWREAEAQHEHAD